MRSSGPDVDLWSTDCTWIGANLSAESEAIGDLIEHGWLWARQWPTWTASFGPTDRALAWVRDAYQMLRADDAHEIADWITYVLAPQFRPVGEPIALELAYSQLRPGKPMRCSIERPSGGTRVRARWPPTESTSSATRFGATTRTSVRFSSNENGSSG